MEALSPVRSNVRLREYGRLQPVGDRIILKNLVDRRTGLFGRFRPTGGDHFALQILDSEFWFDPKREMCVGTKGTAGLFIKPRALALLGDEVILERDHLAIELATDRPTLKPLGNESLLVLRRESETGPFTAFVLTPTGGKPYPIDDEQLKWRLLEKEAGKPDSYIIKEWAIDKVGKGRDNFEVVKFDGGEFLLKANDTILVPLVRRDGQIIWFRLIYEPTLIAPQPAEIEVGTEFLGQRQPALDFLALSHEARLALLDNLEGPLPKPSDFALTQIDEAIRERPDFADLEAWVASRKQELQAATYFDTVRDDCQPAVQAMAEKAWEAGFSVQGRELEINYVLEIFALNWLLRYVAVRKLQQPGEVLQKLEANRQTPAFVAFTQRGTLVEVRPSSSRAADGPPLMDFSFQRINERTDKTSEQLVGWFVADIEQGLSMEFAGEQTNGARQTSPVVLLVEQDVKS